MLFKRFILILILLLLAACGGTPQSVAKKSVKARAGQALLTVYLGSSGTVEVAGNIQLEAIAVEVNDVWIGLGLQSGEIDYQQQKGQQMLLGAVVAPLGEHQRLRLRVRGLPGKDEVQQFVVTLPEPLELRSGDSKCLFIDWQLIAEQLGSQQLVARFTAWGQGQTLSGELLYVACREIDTVYVVRMDINDVVASFGVPGPLAEIRLHQRKLYILSSGKRSIFVYDCLNGRLIDQIALPGSVSPQHMALSTDGTFAFVTDAGAGEVLKVDLLAGTLVNRVLIGHKPQRIIAFSDGQERLALVAPNSQQVFILDAGNLQTIRRIPVGSRPVSLLFFNRSLYVVEQGSQSVAVFDHRSGKQQAKIPVGFKPEYIQAIDRSNAYVSNSGESSLSVLHAGQNVALRKISVGQAPGEWSYSERKRLLYVANGPLQRLTVLKRASGTLLKEIPLGGEPTSLSILE